jgi:nucleoside-diphosphate-sugar epimerase
MTHRLIALTGATGFIGRHVRIRLQAAGFTVRALSRPHRAGVARANGICWVDGTLADSRALAALVRDAGAVIHLAGAIRGRSANEFTTVNVDGTAQLMTAITESAPGAHVVLVSSLAAREPQLSWYAASKRAAETVVQERAQHFTILRPPAVYGAGDAALAPLWRWLARGWLFRAGRHDARFSLVHVDDLAEALTRIVQHGPTGAVLPLHDGTELGYTWAHVAAIARAHRGKPVRTIPVPRRGLGAAAAVNLALARILGRAPMLTPGKVRELSHPDWVCDNVALTQTLHWAPSLQLDDRIRTLPGWAGR